MSYVEIFSINKEGEILSFAEVRNAMAGALLIWEKLGEKYNLLGEGYSMMPGYYEKLWKSCSKGILTPGEDLLVRSTFDNVWLRRDLIPLLAKAMHEFHQEFIAGTNISNTVERAALSLESLLGNTSEEEVIGICFNQTSVNSDIWVGPYNEETGEEEDANLSQFEKAWEAAGREWEPVGERG